MQNEKIDPTYIGHNDGCEFIMPKKLFQMKLKGVIPPKDLKTFSRYIRKTIIGFDIARKTKYGNKNKTKTATTPEFWENFEKKAKQLGADLIGYTTVNENYIFKNLTVYGKNAIVLGMELDWEQIKTAPSYFCAIEAFRVYKELGDIVIELTNYLQEQDYKAEAHHPFGGKLLFPYHAVAANIGIIGQLGLLVTPEFGPRQRIGIITIDADIPLNRKKRDFSEIEEFCNNCGACIKSCKAALEEPVEKIKGSGVISRIDRSECIERLIDDNYCSICLKICSLGHPK